MKNYKSVLWCLSPNILGAIFAFDEKYVYTLILCIFSVFSVIITLIILYYKEKEKTKQVEISEKEATKRTQINATETTRQLEIIKDISLGLNAFTPPEEQRKRNSSNIAFFDEVVKGKTKNIVSGNYIKPVNMNSRSETLKNDDDNSIDALRLYSENLLQGVEEIKDDNGT